MKRLILFKGGVETLEFFTEQMASVWEKMGYSVFWYNLLMQQDSSEKLMNWYRDNRQDEFYMFTFNFEGLAGETGLYSDEGWNFWDYAGVNVVNMVVDHPLYYNRYITRRPQRYIQLDIDELHVEYMRRFFKEVHTEYLLTAGTELNLEGCVLPDRKYLPMSERPIDIIFTGNYTPKKILRKHLDNMEPEYIDFYEEILEYLIDNPSISIDSAAEQALRREFPDITDEQQVSCMPTMMYVDLAVRFHYRELAIRALADSGFKVNAYGEGYDYINCRHPENIIRHGGVDSRKCLDMISQAKISLNVMPWFKRGAHDRVFNTMLNGGVALTDSSDYFTKNFCDGENILFYSLEELREYEKSGFDMDVISASTDKIKRLLADKDELQLIADAGYKLCHGKHSWKERAVVIAEYFTEAGCN